MNTLAGSYSGVVLRTMCTAALACLLLLPIYASAQSEGTSLALKALTAEREILTTELQQYQATLKILQPGDTPPEQSSNPAVKKLAEEVVRLRERLIAVTEQEVTLLQQQISSANATVAATTPAEAVANVAIESKPLRTYGIDYTLAQEAENVERLHSLLASYYTELQESAKTLPTPEEIARRERAQLEAQTLAQIPFSVDKVRLSGAEASTALTQITQRLMDPNIAESRRDTAPICAIKTRLFGKLVSSENRSLKPVGKNNFIAKVRLQPGDTTLRILEHRWEIQLPQHMNAGDFLITLYRRPGDDPELHIFAVDDLMAEEKAHIPAWLPDEFKIKARAG